MLALQKQMEVINMYEVDQYTVSLLHFEDGIKDETGKIWVSSNANVSTDQKKFGNSSLAVDVGKYIYTDDVSDFNFTSQFTIEMWVMFTKYPTMHGGNFVHNLFSQVKDTNNCMAVEVGSTIANSMPGINFDSINGGARIQTGGSYNLNLNTWYHLAFVANGLGGVYLFVNGKLLHQEQLLIKFPLLNSTRACIGKLLYPGAEYDCIGYIDEFRISNIARWTSNFNPGAPTNLTTTAGDSQVTLSWTAVDGAVGYNVKRSTTAGGPYTTIATNVTGTSYVDNAVINGTKYYYVVTAVDSNGIESANSNEASATPVAAPIESGTALLQVTMNNSNEREYQLSIDEIDGFVNWFNHYTSNDTKSYMLNKTVGKEYLAFDKIISFEVIPLTK
jgi:hypothetical protein